MRHFSLISPEISSLSFWKGVMSHKKRSADGSLASGLRQTDRELPSRDKPGHSSITASGNTPVSVPDLQSPSSSTCFSCVYVHIYMCMFVIVRQVKQLEWFTLEQSLVCSTASESVFSHANISNITDDRELGGIEGCTAKHKCHCVIPGIPLCSADGWWGPEHRVGPVIQANIYTKKKPGPYYFSFSWLAKLK